jgi:hypothetical protein
VTLPHIANMSAETELRHRLLAAGFNPLPLYGKRPAIEKWQCRETSTGDIYLWERIFPEATNTGILTGRVPALDIDICDPDAAQAVEDLARERFDERGYVLVRFGRVPKRAILFRTNDPFPKITGNIIAPNGDTSQKIELLGDGQQLAVAGLHPETKKPYSWFGGEPGQIIYDDLPYLSHDDALALVADAVELLVAGHGYSRPVKGKANGGEGGGGSDWAELLANLHAGHELHASVRDLAAKLITTGMGDGAAVNLIRGLLDCSVASRDVDLRNAATT